MTMKHCDSIWKKALWNQQGFTLVEMLVAVTVALIIMTGVTAVFIAHSHHYTQHDDLSVLQNDLRSLLAIMSADIRVAGCDPLEKGQARILKAQENYLIFTADLYSKNNSRYPNESDGKVDSEGECFEYYYQQGEDSSHPGSLKRRNGRYTSGTACSGQLETLFDNIERLEFNYILDDNTSKTEPTTNQRSKKKIRAVQLSVLARAPNPTQGGYTHAGTFTSGSGQTWTVEQDGHRRRFVVTTIQLRNMAY